MDISKGRRDNLTLSSKLKKKTDHSSFKMSRRKCKSILPGLEAEIEDITSVASQLMNALGNARRAFKWMNSSRPFNLLRSKLIPLEESLLILCRERTSRSTPTTFALLLKIDFKLYLFT